MWNIAITLFLIHFVKYYSIKSFWFLTLAFVLSKPKQYTHTIRPYGYGRAVWVYTILNIHHTEPGPDQNSIPILSDPMGTVRPYEYTPYWIYTILNRVQIVCVPIWFWVTFFGLRCRETAGYWQSRGLSEYTKLDSQEKCYFRGYKYLSRQEICGKNTVWMMSYLFLEK